MRTRTYRRFAGLWAALGAAALAAGAPAVADEARHAADNGAPANGFAAAAESDRHWDLLDSYCNECHNVVDWAGGVAFDVHTPEAVPEEIETWEEVVRKMRGRLMPPPGQPQPEDERLYSFVAWMEGYLDEVGAAEPRPGRVDLQRLNRREYANAVRDLLAIELDVEDMLPRDERVEGFDNIAAGLSVSPAFLSQYVEAARVATEMAVGLPEVPTQSRTYRSGHPGTPFGQTSPPGGRPYHVEGLPPGTRDGLSVTHRFPADGEYEIDIADMASALWTYAMEFENEVVVLVDGDVVYRTTLGGEDDLRAIDQDQDPAVDAINERLKNIRFEVEAGPREVAVAFNRRSFAESDDPLHQLRQGSVRGIGHDRVLRVSAFDIRGPFNPRGPGSTPSRDAIFSCYPEAPEQERACAERIMADLSERAYRRPLEDGELAERMAYYDAARQSGDFEFGVRTAITGLLTSPHFLYRGEGVPELPAGAVYRIADLELASRLAFFLWSSLPDAELLEVAAAGRLSEPENLERQVRRMLADRRASTLAGDFAHQWLQLDKLDEVQPDADLFPHASGRHDPRDNFRREISLFVDSIFREDRSVLDLLTAEHTYLNEHLASLYGINDVRGDHFRRVTLRDSVRHGLLGKGAVLLASSYPNRTSPVLRGEYVMHNFIGTPPAAPPPDVEDNLDATTFDPNLTIRERLAQHSEDPSCNGCHGVIDPLGFALENFDVDATWREYDRDNRRPIDATGVLPDGTRVEGPDDLRAALLRRPDQFVQTFTERLMTYALGRVLDARDMPTVRRIVRETAADDYRFSSLVLAVVRSEPFTTREVLEEDAAIMARARDDEHERVTDRVHAGMDPRR